VESKEERASQPVTPSSCELHSLDRAEMLMELYREEKREEGDRSGQEDKGRKETEVAIYPIPLPAGYSTVSSSCLYCCVWGGLSVFWKFVVFSLLGVSSLWVGLYGWLIQVSWLGKLV